MPRRSIQFLVVLVLGVVLGVIGFVISGDQPAGSPAVDVPEARGDPRGSDGAQGTSTTSTTTPATTTAPTTTTTLPVRDPGTVPAWTVGRSWGSTIGLTMFRGNPTRSYFGDGPLPENPTVQWRYPDSQMCRSSSSGGETKIWCGMGWTGQPAVWERPDGKVELVFGAYDGAVHFVDAATGEDLREPFQTDDIIKGSVTIDPDGYPLVYFGSRDNYFRIVALDRETPELMWRLGADAVDGLWNNDWDSNPVVVDDILYEGGENGWLFAIELNREYLGDGLVNVDPEVVFSMPGYNDELIARVGRNVSIESSVAIFDQRLYFTNSGGRIVGLDVSRIREGVAPVVFDYWAGGDIDATPVVDDEGMLYVSIEYEPSQMDQTERERTHEVGQLVKLNPYADNHPRVWGVNLASSTGDSGSWSTPAVRNGVVYVNTHQGDLLAVDADDGTILWSDEVGPHSWSSPAIVGEMLVVATCLGDIRGYDIADPRAPTLDWSLSLGQSCLEATPAIWEGQIFVGSRDGYIRALS